MTLGFEKRMLQIAIGLACLVPVLGGAWGVWHGGGANADLDSHFRYLSGLLLGIGLGFVSTIPKIQTQSNRFRLLTLIVVTGGLSRLVGMVLADAATRFVLLTLVMEIAITPLLCFWQIRLAARWAKRSL